MIYLFFVVVVVESNMCVDLCLYVGECVCVVCMCRCILFSLL